MTPRVEVFDAGFRDMLERYTRLSSLGVADAVNKKMGDLMLTAAKYSPKASRQDIDTLYTREWWYPFVQKVLNVQGVTETVRRRVRKGEGRRIGRKQFAEAHGRVSHPNTGKYRHYLEGKSFLCIQWGCHSTRPTTLLLS